MTQAEYFERNIVISFLAAIPPAPVKPHIITPPPVPQPSSPVEEPSPTEKDETTPELSPNDGQWGQNEQEESEPSDAETQEVECFTYK